MKKRKMSVDAGHELGNALSTYKRITYKQKKYQQQGELILGELATKFTASSATVKIVQVLRLH